MATGQVAKSRRPFKFVLGGPAHLIHVLFQVHRRDHGSVFH